MTTKLTLHYQGKDDWGLAAYKNEEGVFFINTASYGCTNSFYTVSGGFDGEPDTSLKITINTRTT